MLDQATGLVDSIRKAVFADWSLITLCAIFFVGTLVASFIPYLMSYRSEYQVYPTASPHNPIHTTQHTVTSHFGAWCGPAHRRCAANHHP